MARKRIKICKNCNAWDAAGPDIGGKFDGKVRVMHHCKRRCPQIVWMFGGPFDPDIGTTFPATTADNYCMEFEKLESYV
jgi:hypothetical protein